MKDSLQSKLRAADRQNTEAAELILREPDKYPGVMQEWAQEVTAEAPCTHS